MSAELKQLIFVGFHVNVVIMVLIYFLMPPNDTPRYSHRPVHRICGIFVPLHLAVAFASGVVIAFLAFGEMNLKIAFIGFVFQFVFGQMIHLIFKIKTMFLYKFGLSNQPDGTGRLATPIEEPHQFSQ